ncbi:helix-turn-helix domain-containing protein [Olsenella massiliensis]|uniref:helix-turn-helix domain-containing protein n=1 Tax=Olsenella massiliensis TaxID=1622075 RepID=UPI0009E783B5|nr:helix-turn-helix transcriptional regulator [Olsenella massiliensis]
MEVSEIKRLIGNRIRIARTTAHISQVELGEGIGVDKQTVSNWERGLRTPSAENLVAIANVTNSNPNFLTGFSDGITVREH